ncbi:protein gar2-like [Rhinatrema bivittatum]|uniref:protein gar2-like n=1 Tax=Rhinatrema bivittatum TaxID=194408 RepID=UPI00112621C1|nr:protein gar2-like [Rhinatrema bivittatum]
MLRSGRNPNFSLEDVRLLAMLIIEDERHLFFRPGRLRNQIASDAAWQSLRARFNAQASYPREVEALKKRARRLRRQEREWLLALRTGLGQPDDNSNSTSEEEAVFTETEEEESVFTETEEEESLFTETEEETEEEEAVATETEEEEEAVATETEEEEAVATETEEEEAVAMETGEEEAVATEAGEEEAVATEAGEEEAVATEAGEEEAVATEAGEEEAVATEAGEEEAVATEAGEEEAVATEAEEEEAVASEAAEEPEGPPPQPHSLPISCPVSRSDEEPSSDVPSVFQEQEAASRPSSIEARLDAALALIGRLDRRMEALEGLLGAHLAELVQGQQQIIQLLSAMAGAGSPLVLSRPPPRGPPPPPPVTLLLVTPGNISNPCPPSPITYLYICKKK